MGTSAANGAPGWVWRSTPSTTNRAPSWRTVAGPAFTSTIGAPARVIRSSKIHPSGLPLTASATRWMSRNVARLPLNSR